VPIPPFNVYGALPEGVHDCSLDEAQARFGTFQGTDRRPRLWSKLIEYLAAAKATGVVEALLLDGSFVTSEPNPNDLDIVVIVPDSHDFRTDLAPNRYNVLAQRRVQKQFGFDIVVVKNGSENLGQAIAFFEQVRQRPGAKKGIVRIVL
jgi:hypothetical protein